LTKIIGKRSRHSMLASTPASILNHKTSKNGIPADSTKSGYALRADIAVVRKADVIRTATRELSKIWVIGGVPFSCAGRLCLSVALVKEICVWQLGGGRFDFRNRLSTSR
ncbi:hypothetical protein, partial [Rhizobium laguerreae]|uniref:hypothetical protein n=1 Tax=Rhizobium laguerreae TaxID=1076926 RepID=UPI001C8FEBD4